MKVLRFCLSQGKPEDVNQLQTKAPLSASASLTDLLQWRRGQEGAAKRIVDDTMKWIATVKDKEEEGKSPKGRKLPKTKSTIAAVEKKISKAADQDAVPNNQPKLNKFLLPTAASAGSMLSSSSISAPSPQTPASSSTSAPSSTSSSSSWYGGFCNYVLSPMHNRSASSRDSPADPPRTRVATKSVQRCRAAGEP